MKNLIDIRAKIFLLLTLVLLINISGFAQKKKTVKKKVTPAQAQQPNTVPLKSVEINRKPFEDLADLINSKLEKNEIDLSKNFEVVLDGTITADGKLDPKKSKFVKAEGDDEMVGTAKSALEALGDSGFLGFLKEKGIDKINLTFAQNETETYAILLSDIKTPEKSATLASFLSTMLTVSILFDKNGVKKLDDLAKVFVNNSKATSEGKNFRLDIKFRKDEALSLLKQILEKRAEKKKMDQ